MKVILQMCITADGKIGRTSDHLADWTSKEDKQLFVAVTKRAGVMIMGAKTYSTIGRPLPDRLILVMSYDAESEQSIPGQVEFVKGDPADILASLEARGFKECVIAGGATINGLFLAAGLIDEMILTVEPVVFGSGLPLFGEVGGAPFAQDTKLHLLSVDRLNETVVSLHYKVIKAV